MTEPYLPILVEDSPSFESRYYEAQQLLELHPDALLILGGDRQLRFANEAARGLLGHIQSSLEGELLRHSLLGEGGPKELEVTDVEGRVRALEVEKRGVFWEGEASSMVVLRDVTRHKSRAERWQHEALHDPLTGLPNRSLFLDRLGQAIERTRRELHRSFAVLFLDLDGFKAINDSLGHGGGDQILKILSRRLEGCIRSGDTLARMGGDEFTVLLDDIREEASARQVAARMLEALQEPVSLAGVSFQLSASIGIAFHHRPDLSAQELLDNADVAMYQAKARGKNRFEIFDATQSSSPPLPRLPF